MRALLGLLLLLVLFWDFIAENFKGILLPPQKSRVHRANRTLAVVRDPLVGPGYLPKPSFPRDLSGLYITLFLTHCPFLILSPDGLTSTYLL